jgi:hypothetical protein
VLANRVLRRIFGSKREEVTRGWRKVLYNLYSLPHISKKGKKLSLYRLWRPLGLREVEVPTFSDIRLTDGGKVVIPTCRPLFTPRKIRGTHVC